MVVSSGYIMCIIAANNCRCEKGKVIYSVYREDSLWWLVVEMKIEVVGDDGDNIGKLRWSATTMVMMEN